MLRNVATKSAASRSTFAPAICFLPKIHSARILPSRICVNTSSACVRRPLAACQRPIDSGANAKILAHWPFQLDQERAAGCAPLQRAGEGGQQYVVDLRSVRGGPLVE